MQPYMSCYSYLSTTQDISSLETCKKENCIYVLCFGQKLVGFLATMSQCICSFIFAEWLCDEEREGARQEGETFPIIWNTNHEPVKSIW